MRSGLCHELLVLPHELRQRRVDGLGPRVQGDLVLEQTALVFLFEPADDELCVLLLKKTALVGVLLHPSANNVRCGLAQDNDRVGGHLQDPLLDMPGVRPAVGVLPVATVAVVQPGVHRLVDLHSHHVVVVIRIEDRRDMVLHVVPLEHLLLRAGQREKALLLVLRESQPRWVLGPALGPVCPQFSRRLPGMAEVGDLPVVVEAYAISHYLFSPLRKRVTQGCRA